MKKAPLIACKCVLPVISTLVLISCASGTDTLSRQGEVAGFAYRKRQRWYYIRGTRIACLYPGVPVPLFCSIGGDGLHLSQRFNAWPARRSRRLRRVHRDGRRFVARADEKLTAFLELQSAISKNSIDTSVGGWKYHIRAKFVRTLSLRHST
jgi:hypothetical protein